MIIDRMEVFPKNGRWTVNGKRLEDLNLDEKNFLNDFFVEMKSWFEEENKAHGISN